MRIQKQNIILDLIYFLCYKKVNASGLTRHTAQEEKHETQYYV